MGVDVAPAFQMGKIMECGGQCAIPKGRSMIATIRKDSFDLTPLNPIERCTPLSVAAHSLYEKTRPDQLPGPGGVLHVDGAKYEMLADGRTTRCSGARFVPTPTYQVKLEGAAYVGHRAIFIGGFRDPILIAQLDSFLDSVRSYTQGLFPELDKSDECRLIFHVYGRDAVMGPLEPNPTPSHEVGLFGEIVAPTEAKAMAIANSARVSCLHLFYPGVMATAGNFASPLSPHEQNAGPVFKFNIYHLMDIEDPADPNLFPIVHHTVGSNNSFVPKPDYGKAFFDDADFTGIEPEKPIIRQVPTTETTMRYAARVVRSKNSGPFELTFDIMFDDPATYERVKSADVLNNSVMQSLYKITDSDIIVNMFFDPALAWKCTIKRPWAQGSVGERDTLGTAQHAPLLDIVIPALTGIENTS
jgi:hypothetical protein